MTGDQWQGIDLALPVDLEYRGEFGPELVLFLPFVNWLSKIGLLKRRRIITYAGMRCFYDDLGSMDVVEKTIKREYIPANKRPNWLPVKNEHDFDGGCRSPQHSYPDLRSRFVKLPLEPKIFSDTHPILVIHNKYNSEWDGPPVNYIDLDTLEYLFRRLSTNHTVVYIRHGMSNARPDILSDQNASLDFADLDLLKQFPAVVSFDDAYAAHRERGGQQDINTFKNVLYSRTYRFISVQGGGAHQIALYSGSFLTVFHRRGSEERWAYRDGYYNFMAPVPPCLAVSRTDAQLRDSAALFEGSTVANNRIFLDAKQYALLLRLAA